jgi:hypothetical protein
MELMVELVGMKAFKGKLDGKEINSGSLYTMVKLDERYNKKDQESTNWKFGHSIEEWRVPDADIVMRLAHLKPSVKHPVTVRLEVERVSNGRETKEVVLNCRPMNDVADPLTGEVAPPTLLGAALRASKAVSA